jgi:hypothetical protein
MIARRNLMAEALRRRSNQPLQRKQLFRGNHFVSAPGKEVHRVQYAREIYFLPEGDEACCSQFIALVKFLDDFEVISPGNIDRP